MGASIQTGGTGGGSRRRRGRKSRPMAEINVTPFVDVTLVLLIIFMVAAPMLSTGVPVDLPKSEGGEAIQSDTEPLSVSVDGQGKVFIQDHEIAMEELTAKITALASVRKGFDEAIFIRGDKTTNYQEFMSVIGRITAAGYKHISLVTQADDSQAKK